MIAYNGEIYNHMQLRRELDAAGASPAWRGHSDTETLLAAVEAWGVEATLKRCVGMFAFVLWDRAERALWLARDRVGEKPLYYGWQGKTFLFGSELKALRAHPDFMNTVDRGALALMVRHNYIPAPYSIHEGIRKLPPGSLARLKDGRLTGPEPYWSMADVACHGERNQFGSGDESAVTALEQRLGSAVRGQMMADVPLGALLSGGIDSTLVTALMQANSSKAIRTFTIGFDEHGYDEATHARAVAVHLGTDHTEVRLAATDALALVPALPDIYDEPFADSSQLPTYLVMQVARQSVTVALSGDGGDEFFGGYNRYFLAPRAWKRAKVLPIPLRRIFGSILAALPAHSMNRIPARFAPVALPGDKLNKLGDKIRDARSLEDLYVALVSEWRRDGSPVVGAREFPPNFLDQRDRWPSLENPVARLMAIDAFTYLPDDILAKVDRAAMAVSLETRAPFLDPGVMQFAWSLPMKMKIRDGRGKWILRSLLDRHVPRSLVDRPKMGFGVPLDDWLRGPLRPWAENLLDETKIRQEGFFDPKPIRRAWQAHLNGLGYGYKLWSILMFQAWYAHQSDSGLQPR